MDFVNSSGGQMLLVEALMAAASLFAAKQINHEDGADVLAHPIDSLKRAGRTVGDRTGDAQDKVARNTARLQFALTEAVRAFRAALAEPAPANEASALDEPEPEVGKKKSRSGSEPAVPH
jgi:hypothetical protein